VSTRAARFSVRDLGFYLRGRINSGLTRLLNGPRPHHAITPPPLDDVLRGPRDPRALVALLEARANAAREAAVAAYLTARGVPFRRHRFATFEGHGENFSVDVGSGDRLLLLIAHHDAVPGSPGANDNAAAVGILLHLLERVRVPSPLRVRFLFTAAEELGYLGARAYVKEMDQEAIAGVLSLELCGIGDSLAVWDAAEDSPFLVRVRAGFEGYGLRANETYHQVGRIPVFGSDHRAFAAFGIPAYGLTVIPTAEADGLRQFIFSPMRSAFRQLVRRPVPFDTYHTPADAGATLQPAALTAVAGALEAVVSEVR
jgi:hypothetical protein